jgi:LCP family protein required for cell wall assembly
VWRVVRWIAVAVLAWIAISIAALLISAGTGHVGSRTEAALKPAGFPLWSVNNVLVLGSDARPKGSKEPGADPGGPSRADSIMLLRVGGGHSARLSIARDTLVDIPGYGQSKINAAYAYGGPALQIKTVEQYTGIPINHVILVDFEHFPRLIDALGGITYKGGCVISKINGGNRNGGYTLRLERGSHHLDGEQALALARTRKNECNASEDDLDRAAHQQQVLGGMKSKVASFGGLFGIPHGSFYRLPLVGWEAPKAMRTDMSGPTLAGVFGALAIGGSPKTAVLGTESGVVPDSLKQQMVHRFLKG